MPRSQEAAAAAYDAATSGDTGAPRRRIALVVAGILAVGPLALLTATGATQLATECGPGGEPLSGLPGPTVCVHGDEPPPGVDVTDPVSTAELLRREGAGEQAFEAADALGAPSTVAAAVTGPAVRCDGDGTSGYRTQAMYVVEAGATNRYASLLGQFKLWAAGTDDVINRSAALTGGVRNVRYVTETGADGTCEAKVLNVTVPAGSTSSFGATIQAVQALGYDLPNRKYLMWVDARVLCGVATMYPYDTDGQGNVNNGSYAQYARVDSGCWGYGDGGHQNSVEAHELVHTLGAVMETAPHGTRPGHCFDESDTMCYADGGGKAMQQVCPLEREYLLDCNSDDYFSTYPAPGSWLDTHWNAADSRFLIGGGDGTGGGSPGTPTVLGASLAVNNPLVPGLRTQVEVTPSLPSGRTVTKVAWKAVRTDCTFDPADQLQSAVTCPASATGSTTVSATITDSAGATKTVSGPLTFAAGGTPRAVVLTTTVAGQAGSPASVCTGAAAPVAATVTDVTSGLPVKGLSVAFTKVAKGATTAPVAAGSAAATATGTATVSLVATTSTDVSARTAATTTYAASVSSAQTAVPARCTTTLTGAASAADVDHGTGVTVSGLLTRVAGGTQVPVSGASVPVTLGYVENGVARSVALGTARTLVDGTWTLVVKPLRSGTLRAALPASTAYTASAVDLGAVTVHPATTELTAAVDRTDVGHGSPVVVTGRLTKTPRSTAVPVALAGAALKVTVTTAAGTTTTVGSGTTKADGSYTVSLPLRTSGTMTVGYAGAAGLPADSVALGPVTAGTWSTDLTLRVAVDGTVRVLSGTLTRTYGTVTQVAPSVRVQLRFTPADGTAPTTVSTPTTTAAGAFTARLTPTRNGTYTAVVSGVAGHANATSAGVPVTVG